VAAVVLTAWLIAPVGAMAGADPPTQAVDALHTAINGSDVDSSSNLFADDAVVIQPRIGGLPQVYVGQEQIRWWLRNLAAQHTQWNVVEPARVVSPNDLQWSDALSLDTFSELGLGSVEVNSELVLAADGRIESLTTVLTPASARATFNR
jgi:hypothetical protein